MIRRSLAVALAAGLVVGIGSCKNNDRNPSAATASGSAGGFEVTINASSTSGRAPLEVRFTSEVQGGGAPVTYAWDFGDGTGASIPNPTKNFASGGTFPVTLRLVAGDRTVSSSSITIRVDSDVRLGCFSDPEEGLTPLTVRFRAEPLGGTGSYTYLWTFGDGGSSAERSPVYTFQSGGVFTHRLTVTSGGAQASCTGPVYVYDSFSVGCRASFLGGTTVHFRALPNFCIANSCSYVWNFGDGTGLVGGPPAFNPNHDYPTSGTYTASVTAQTGRLRDTCVLNVTVP